MRFHTLDVKRIRHASRRLNATAGNGSHFDETQAANRFQMNTSHKARTNNCSSNPFHEARRLSILMGRCKNGGTGYPAVLARLSTAAW
jgi:hypothetical protein